MLLVDVVLHRPGMRRAFCESSSVSAILSSGIAAYTALYLWDPSEQYIFSLCLHVFVLTSLLVCFDSQVHSLFEIIVTRIEKIESNKYISSSFTPYLYP